LEDKSSNGWIGPVIFLILIGLWTYFNYQNAGKELKKACTDSSASLTKSVVKLDALCDCTRDEAMAEFSPISFVPLLGRLAAPKDAEANNIGVRSMAICMSRELGMDISPSDLDGYLQDED